MPCTLLLTRLVCTCSVNACVVSQVIQVGRHTFEFTVRKEDRVCDLLRLPAVDGTAAIEIGSVQQSLLVKVLIRRRTLHLWWHSCTSHDVVHAILSLALHHTMPAFLQRDLEAERLRMRQRSQQADEQQHLRTTVLLENSGRKASGQRPRSVLASGNGGLHAAPHRGLHGDKQRGGSPAPRAQSPALPAEGPHRSQSPALAAQPQVAAKKNAARSKLGEQTMLSDMNDHPSCRVQQYRDVLLDKHCQSAWLQAFCVDQPAPPAPLPHPWLLAW